MKTTLIPFLSATIILIIGCGEKSSEPEPPTPGPTAITLHVPADLPTIEAALDSAKSGDTVLLADGVYTGQGNHDIIFPCKSVVLKSENGPLYTIIDCEGSSTSQHFGFQFINCDSVPKIEGITIRNGFYNMGAAVFCQSFSPDISYCIFADNHATVSGGAVRCKSASPNFSSCTFVRNSTDMAGAGFFLIAGAQPMISNSIISHSSNGEAIYSSDNTSIPLLMCCDIYGNAGGNVTSNIADQFEMQNGKVVNYTFDPNYCDLDNDDFRISPTSQCAPENNPCGMHIGAGPSGCD